MGSLMQDSGRWNPLARSKQANHTCSSTDQLASRFSDSGGNYSSEGQKAA